MDLSPRHLMAREIQERRNHQNGRWRCKSCLPNDMVNHQITTYFLQIDNLTVDVQTLMIVLLLSKFGFQANEAVTNLKLLEKGFSKEDLALTVLIDFPFSILFGYYAAKWSSGPYPLKPWMLAFVGRLLAAILNMVVVIMFPKSGVGFVYFVLVIIAHVGTSFMRYTPAREGLMQYGDVRQCIGISYTNCRSSDWRDVSHVTQHGIQSRWNLA